MGGMKRQCSVVELQFAYLRLSTASRWTAGAGREQPGTVVLQRIAWNCTYLFGVSTAALWIPFLTCPQHMLIASIRAARTHLGSGSHGILVLRFDGAQRTGASFRTLALK